MAAPRSDIDQLKTMLAEIQSKISTMEGQEVRPSRHVAAPVVPANVPLEKKIEIALTDQSLSTKDLAKELHADFDKVQALVMKFKKDGKIFNMGFDEPNTIWAWRVGDNTDGPTLRAVIKRLIQERPMTLRDLVNATGAKNSKVSGHMVEIQRTNDVKDLSGGKSHAKLYFLFPEDTQSAKLMSQSEQRRLRREAKAKKA